MINGLATYGYEVVFASLPSLGWSGAPLVPTMEDDAACIRSLVMKLLDKRKDVILAAHSYGGIPATEAAKGLTCSFERSACRFGVYNVLYPIGW